MLLHSFSALYVMVSPPLHIVFLPAGPPGRPGESGYPGKDCLTPLQGPRGDRGYEGPMGPSGFYVSSYVDLFLCHC